MTAPATLRSWRCARCGEEHEGLPLDWAVEAPGYWDGGRSPGDRLTEDLCTWTDDDGRLNYFIRGVLHVPVPELADTLRYGVWSSLSERSFERVLELWDDERRTAEPPYFGWLSNAIRGYPDTLQLPLDVVTDAVELRPSLVLRDAEHPLVREQRDGISLERLLELVALNVHAA